MTSKGSILCSPVSVFRAHPQGWCRAGGVPRDGGPQSQRTLPGEEWCWTSCADGLRSQDARLGGLAILCSESCISATEQGAGSPLRHAALGRRVGAGAELPTFLSRSFPTTLPSGDSHSFSGLVTCKVEHMECQCPFRDTGSGPVGRSHSGTVCVTLPLLLLEGVTFPMCCRPTDARLGSRRSFLTVEFPP